jgi:small subunit ribosomal protein S6
MSTATTAVKQRHYELIYLLKQDASEDQISAIQNRLSNTLQQQFNGSVIKEESWGKRRLAYTIKKGNEKHNRALYQHMIFLADPNAVQELERLLRITDFCIRFMHIRLDRFNPAAQLKSAESATNTESSEEATV